MHSRFGRASRLLIVLFAITFLACGEADETTDPGESQDEDSGESQDEDPDGSQDEDSGESQDEDSGESQDEDSGESQDEDSGESQDEDPDESQEESQNEEKCPLEYETFCEGSDCCPEGCHSLVGWVLDVNEGCRLDSDEAHWCISPTIFTPGTEEINNTVPACYYDDETELALMTGTPADGLHTTGGPLLQCDSDIDQDVFDVDPEPCPASD